MLQRYRDEGMLYVVPSGGNDDWYWMYSSILENQGHGAFVVTNDLMRDHRLAFMVK